MKNVLKTKFDWDVTDLPEYTNAESQEILTREVLEAETLSLIRIQEGVKHKEVIKRLDTDVVWSDGAACGFAPSGDVDFTEREIEVKNIKLEKEFCNLDLLEKWTNQALRSGAMAELEELPYRDLITTHLLSLQAMEVEKALWNGNVATGTGNLSYFDGFETLLAGVTGDMIDVNVAAYTAINSTNAYDVFYSAYENMSATDAGQAVLEKGAIAMVTRNQYNALIKNIVDLNAYHFDPTGAASAKTFVLPGTDLTIRRINGRTDDTKFYIGIADNFVFGTDLTSDSLNLKVWYNEDSETIRFRLRMKAGVQVAFPNEIGYFELAV